VPVVKKILLYITHNPKEALVKDPLSGYADLSEDQSFPPKKHGSEFKHLKELAELIYQRITYSLKCGYFLENITTTTCIPPCGKSSFLCFFCSREQGH